MSEEIESMSEEMGEEWGEDMGDSGLEDPLLLAFLDAGLLFSSLNSKNSYSSSSSYSIFSTLCVCVCIYVSKMCIFAFERLEVQHSRVSYLVLKIQLLLEQVDHLDEVLVQCLALAAREFGDFLREGVEQGAKEVQSDEGKGFLGVGG